MNRWPLRLLVAGLALCLGAPLAGFGFTVIGMISAFHHLGASGVSDPQTLATDIGHGLIATWIGLFVALVLGLPMLITGFVLLYRGRKAG